MGSLEVLAAEWELELVRREGLPAAAVRLLTDGYDSPSLAVLAGLEPTDIDEAAGLFGKVLTELNVPAPGKADAALEIARDVSRRVLSGAMTPYEAARGIAHVASVSGEHLPTLDTFVYADSEWDERPEDGDVFAAGVVAAARDLAG